MNKDSLSLPQRRAFLAWGVGGFGAFLLGAGNRGALGAANDTRLYLDPATLGELQASDGNGLRLPRGFASRIVARSGQIVHDGSPYRWHNAPDGGACFATDDGGWIYVSNSEVKQVAGGGGVGALRFAANGDIVAAYPILEQSDNNCAGGGTPWRTWLSCEEVDRGFVHECDPYGHKAAELRPALGRFRHEAVAVDPEQGRLYLTEDEPDGALYRFIPDKGLPDLSAGTLQVAEVVTRDERMTVRWHDVPDPAATSERTSHQVGATTHFNGGEGIAWHNGLLYFTTKGDNRVWQYDTVSGELMVLYQAQTSATPHLSGVDNLTITAAGDVLVAEDGGDMQIVLLTPGGLVLPVVQVVGQDASEICGPAFDPSFQRLYFSSQTGPANRDDDGITYEIRRLI